jgi:hypothetical protein
VKEGQCQSYQLASQSLCSDLLLHSRFQGARHEGGNVMEYRTVGEGLKEKESEDESEEDDDSFNGDAYNLEEKEDVGLVKGEEGGVVHLVHGWIQQNQPEKVSD